MTPSMSPIVRRPSLFWPLTLLTLVAGLALCLYGSSLWLDLADPQLVFNGNGPDVHFSVQGWGDWAGGSAALLAAAVLIGLMLFCWWPKLLLLVGVAILVVASAALAPAGAAGAWALSGLACAAADPANLGPDPKGPSPAPPDFWHDAGPDSTGGDP